MTCLRPAVVSLALGIGMGSVPDAEAAPGDLDPSFGNGGQVTMNFTDDAEVAQDLAVLPDGKLLVIGTFDLLRLLPDGTPDPTFGLGGKRTDFTATSATALLPLADGRFLTTGSRFDLQAIGDSDFTATRFFENGSVDRSFGENGNASVNPGPGRDLAVGGALQPDGKSVLAGCFQVNPANPNAQGSQMALTVRFLPDGQPDPDFGIGGQVRTPGFDEARCVTVQDDGRIVIAGWAWNPGGTGIDFALFRHQADGTPDSTFGTNGMAIADFGDYPDIVHSVLIQPDGKILAGGVALSPAPATFDFGMARFLADGTLDPSFGQGGLVTTDFPASNFGGFDAIQGLTLQPDGKIIAVGNGHDASFPFSSPPEAAVARYLPDGTLDPSFGQGGQVTTNFGDDPDKYYAVAVLDDGRIVAAGLAQNGDFPYDDFAIARYLGDGATGVGTEIASSTLDLRAWPNPFSGRVAFRLGRIEQGRNVTLRLVDAAGRLVWSRPVSGHGQGPATVAWDGRGAGGVPVASGTYFLVAESERERAVRKLVRVK